MADQHQTWKEDTRSDPLHAIISQSMPSTEPELDKLVEVRAARVDEAAVTKLSLKSQMK